MSLSRISSSEDDGRERRMITFYITHVRAQLENHPIVLPSSATWADLYDAITEACNEFPGSIIIDNIRMLVNLTNTLESVFPHHKTGDEIDVWIEPAKRPWDAYDMLLPDADEPYVLFPKDDPLRGIVMYDNPYRATSSSSEEEDDGPSLPVREPPLTLDTLVWYIADNQVYYSMQWWYVPAKITGYVMHKQRSMRVIGYQIEIENAEKLTAEQDNQYRYVLDETRNVPPAKVVARWDGVFPSCPVPGVDIRRITMTEKEDTSIALPSPGELEEGPLIGVPENTTKNASAILERQLSTVPSSSSSYTGPKQNGLGPEMWGITMEQLEKILYDENFEMAKTSNLLLGGRYAGGMSMYDVVEKVIKPKTQGKGLGYAMLLNQSKPLRAKVMISHAWQEDYENFLNALRESGLRGPFWVCAMAIYQNEDIPSMTIAKQVSSRPALGPFASVLRQAERMVVILTTEVDIYSRLWCVYEMFQATLLSVPVQLVYNSDRRGYLSSDTITVIPLLNDCDKVIQTSAATCGVPSDAKLIREEVIESLGNDGFEVIDDVVSWLRISALIQQRTTRGSAVDNETTCIVPIGICSSSCVQARMDAAAARAIHVWKKSIAKRQQQHLQTKTQTSITQRDGTSTVPPVSCCKRVMELLIGG